MSKAFTQAAASYLGMEPEKVASSTITANDEGISVMFKVKLTDADIIGVAKRMEELAGGKVHLGSAASFKAGPRAEARMSGNEPDPYSAQAIYDKMRANRSISHNDDGTLRYPPGQEDNRFVTGTGWQGSVAGQIVYPNQPIKGHP